LSLEEIERDNLDRIERLLIDKHGQLSGQLTRSIELIRHNLTKYEIGETILDRINDSMYEVSLLEDIKVAEEEVKHLADTLWDQMEV
jgi:hypothetical protein